MIARINTTLILVVGILIQVSYGQELPDRSFTYTKLPYKVDKTVGSRGPQFGYNKCNSTTESQTSLCQTSMVNSLDDFCLWAPSQPYSYVSDTYSQVVSWCTKPGRGTRAIPPGALLGVQFIKTPYYVMVHGKINPYLLNIALDDDGKLLSPRGKDGRGNPIGGLVFSNAFNSNKEDVTNFGQVKHWFNWMGSIDDHDDVGRFCLRACNPSLGPEAERYCTDQLDRLGCFWNAPSEYKESVYETCDADIGLPPGVYTGTDRELTTWVQPTGNVRIDPIPFVPYVPQSSNCQGYSSVNLYTFAIPTLPPLTTTPKPTATATSSTSSSTQTSNDENKGGPNIGPLIGGVIAGLVFVVILVYLLLRWKRKRDDAHIDVPRKEFVDLEGTQRDSFSTHRTAFTMRTSADAEARPWEYLPEPVLPFPPRDLPSKEMAFSPTEGMDEEFPISPFADPPGASPVSDSPAGDDEEGPNIMELASAIASSIMTNQTTSPIDRPTSSTQTDLTHIIARELLDRRASERRAPAPPAYDFKG